MSFEELQKLFELQRENMKKRTNKVITIPVEQLSQIEQEYINVKKALNIYRNEAEKYKKKYKEQVNKTKSWSAKYNAIIRKEKNEIYDELYHSQQERLEKAAKYHLEYQQQQLEEEYLAKKMDIRQNIKEGIKEVIDTFVDRLSKEKDRYEEQYDLENERNQGYLIGIAKTRKELIKAFEEYEKKVIKKL